MHGSVKSNNKSPVFWWFVPTTPGKCRVVYCFTNSCIQIHQNSSTEVKPQPVSPPSWPVAAWYSGHASVLPAYKPPPRGGWYTVQHLQLDHRIAAVGVLKRQMCWNVSGERDAGQKACPWPQVDMRFSDSIFIGKKHQSTVPSRQPKVCCECWLKYRTNHQAKIAPLMAKILLPRSASFILLGCICMINSTLICVPGEKWVKTAWSTSYIEKWVLSQFGIIIVDLYYICILSNL